MMKRYGWDRTDLHLSGKAAAFYLESDGVVIWQTGEDEWIVDNAGDVRENLTEAEVNEFLEELADYPETELD